MTDRLTFAQRAVLTTRILESVSCSRTKPTSITRYHRPCFARTEFVSGAQMAHVTAANVNDITHLDALVADLPAVRGRRGRPRRRPDVLQGDRGYDSQPHRDSLA